MNDDPVNVQGYNSCKKTDFKFTLDGFGKRQIC